MKIPERLRPLIEDGIIDDVVGEVKSGKEAQVYLVRCGGELRCAKVYKEAIHRSFKQAVHYQEGRKHQSSRTARAMNRHTRFGRKESEASWISAEADALYTLTAAGVRVPKPFGFHDGVLIMELIADDEGAPAPRLNDVSLSAEVAREYHGRLIAQVVRMLCAGIIHGDLSEFNVLVDARGPVIIDLPQAVNAAGNPGARRMFLRDVDNLAGYFGAFAPELRATDYGREIWAVYEHGRLTPETPLTGRFIGSGKKAQVGAVLSAIKEARWEHELLARKKVPTK